MFGDDWLRHKSWEQQSRADDLKKKLNDLELNALIHGASSEIKREIENLKREALLGSAYQSTGGGVFNSYPFRGIGIEGRLNEIEKRLDDIKNRRPKPDEPQIDSSNSVYNPSLSHADIRNKIDELRAIISEAEGTICSEKETKEILNKLNNIYSRDIFWVRPITPLDASLRLGIIEVELMIALLRNRVMNSKNTFFSDWLSSIQRWFQRNEKYFFEASAIEPLKRNLHALALCIKVDEMRDRVSKCDNVKIQQKFSRFEWKVKEWSAPYHYWIRWEPFWKPGQLSSVHDESERRLSQTIEEELQTIEDELNRTGWEPNCKSPTHLVDRPADATPHTTYPNEAMKAILNNNDRRDTTKDVTGTKSREVDQNFETLQFVCSGAPAKKRRMNREKKANAIRQRIVKLIEQAPSAGDGERIREELSILLKRYDSALVAYGYSFRFFDAIQEISRDLIVLTKMS